MGEDLIAENPSGGVLGFITNHGYLDNPTFRGMRWHLLNTFDKIWVLDLHGNSKKLEVSPDGSPDKNVFDIQQGVALIVAVRTGNGSSDLADLNYGDLWGTRQAKNEALWSLAKGEASSIAIKHEAPGYPFEPRDQMLQSLYRKGFDTSALFTQNAVGMMSKRDHIAYADSATEIEKRLHDFLALTSSELERKYGNLYESRDWSVEKTKSNIQTFGMHRIRELLNFPFDIKYTYHTDNSRGFLAYPVY